jgi:branched-chain amino acid aminotransferase
MPEPLAYLNGQYVPRKDARLPLHDAGFVFGATVTDLCRTFKHEIFRLSDHLARFRRSCTAAAIPQPLEDHEVVAIAERLVAHNAAQLRPEQDLTLVMFATPGPIAHYAGYDLGAGEAIPTLGMHTSPLSFGRFRPFFQQGARLLIPRTRHVPAESVDRRIKQRSRLHWWLAEQETRQYEPGAVALLLDAEDHVTETAGANLLVVRGGQVLSPPGSAILGGISLQTVRELCSELSISCEERSLTLQDCLTAEEAFLSSTPYCIAGISQIAGTTIPWPGPIFQRLLSAWSARVGVDIRRQILSNP